MGGGSDFYIENVLVPSTKMPKENCWVVVLVFFVENGLVLIRSTILVPAPPLFETWKKNIAYTHKIR